MDKVSVICLCYNHATFIERAILSVLGQTYEHIEFIIVDDASTDNSRSVIEAFIENRPEIKFLPLTQNIGNCAAFNYGFSHCTGNYIIDLAGDDELYPEKIEKQLDFFNTLDSDYGVVHHDVEVVDEQGELLWYHFDKIKSNFADGLFPEGHIFETLISKFYVSAPSMMVKREVLEKLGGYDERLSYEDFDFWVRSSFQYKYARMDEILVRVRKVRGSMTDLNLEKFNKYSQSTLQVCKKAIELSAGNLSKKAISDRIQYEYRQALRFRSKAMAKEWVMLARETDSVNWQIRLFPIVKFLL